MAVCMECGRKLRSQQSKEVGYGPVCYKRVLRGMADDAPTNANESGESIAKKMRKIL